jgi:formylglycine-generating enzyme required for sulfatase activity
MKPCFRRIFLISVLISIYVLKLHSQIITGFEGHSGKVIKLNLKQDSSLALLQSRPLFSFHLNNTFHSTANAIFSGEDAEWTGLFDGILKITGKASGDSSSLHFEIIFENTGSDTIRLSNVVPFGFDSVSSVHITGRGPEDLARAWISRPGYRAVRVILPDNAWEMGYTSFQITKNTSVCAIARRTGWERAQRSRYETILPPDSKVIYTLYSELFSGEWQNGLKLMFRDRYLHDLKVFDNSLYEREDLQWIKNSYLIILQMAWDREFYDRLAGRYNFAEVIKRGIAQFGSIDVLGIWPTWPRLGLDQRNQWDLYRDLPGGTKQLRNFATIARQAGTKFFIAYNPWDNSTRQEKQVAGMAQIIAETEADGVVLDTQGKSNERMQNAADSVRKGVVMYSEGMAVPKDMPGIISGRVHNAIYYSPELNLNKLIKPDFAIFRVCDIGEEMIHRELAISFFNGYGTELNMYRPGGRDENYRQDLDYLAETTFILRQNTDAFTDHNWTPMIETVTDDVFVNRWSAGDKIVYTVLNLKPEGYEGALFPGIKKENRHWVSLWNHEELSAVIKGGSSYIPAKVKGWHSSYNGTRREGSVECIAEFPKLLKPVLSGDSLKLNSTGFTRVLLWKGNPSYKVQPTELTIKNDTTVRVRDIFGYYEGKIVVQLLDNKILVDEAIVNFNAGTPWIISKVVRTERAVYIPEDMVLVPGGAFSYNVKGNEDIMPYPEVSDKVVALDSFLIDRYPVTNVEFYEFIMNSGYRPADTSRFLRHWVGGVFKQGQDRYPVVNLSYEDMNAYAKWAGKRLPTEAEWQLAAQGNDKRVWPWGNEFHGAFCNNSFGRPTPVDAFPKGQSPSGVMDLVGNIWQMTNDMYFNGSYYMTIIRGGSHFKPESNIWYMQGGPQQLDKTQMLLLVSPGFDRSSTLGFRCVKDIDPGSFRVRK